MGKAGKERKRRRLDITDTSMLPRQGKNDAHTTVASPSNSDVDLSKCDSDDANIALEDLHQAAITIQRLVAYPALLKSPALRPLRAALYALQTPQSSNASLTAQISTALREGAWTDALCHLASMRIRQQKPKLGALQRWIRDLDALTGDPIILRVIDAIMRTVDPLAVPEHDRNVHIKAVEGLRRHAPWLGQPLSGDMVCETVSQGALLDLEETDRLRKSFRVIHQTPGRERLPPNQHPAVLYVSDPNIIPLSPCHTLSACRPVPNLPNVTFISSLLTRSECRAIITATESVGMLPDQPVGGSAATLTSILAHNFYWLADLSFIDTLFARVQGLLPPNVEGGVLRGLNRRFRVYRYVKGAVYRPHIDGAWPPSSVSPAGDYVYDGSPASAPQSSRFTFLIYLNDDFTHGATTFYTPSARDGVMDAWPVQPVAGCAVFFLHGETVGSLVHEGSEVGEGAKYVIRTDVLYDVVSTNGGRAKQL